MKHTVATYLSRVRQQFLDDGKQPYLWTDADIVDYLNDSLEEFCLETRVLRDSFTQAICRIPFALASFSGELDFSAANKTISYESGGLPSLGFMPGDSITVTGTAFNNGTFTLSAVAENTLTTVEALQDEQDIQCSVASNGYRYIYPLDGRILFIEDVRLESTGKSLGKHGQLFLGSAWRDKGVVTDYSLDVQANMIAVTKRPEAADALNLTVIRLPLTTFTTSDAGAFPEINVLYHPWLIDGILSRAYAKQDAEAEDQVRATKHRAAWLNNIERAKRGTIANYARNSVAVPLRAFS